MCPKYKCSISEDDDDEDDDDDDEDVVEEDSVQLKKYIFINYPDIFEDVTVLISQEQRDNPAMYFYPQDHRDLKYSGMDVSYFLAFLSEMKKKDNGKIASYSHISKFYDAIKYCSKVAGRHLSLDFYSKTDTFLLCFKNEFAQAQKQGNMDKKEADAVSITLLLLLVLWAVEEGNIFVWVLCLCMWYLIAHLAMLIVSFSFLHLNPSFSKIDIISSTLKLKPVLAAKKSIGKSMVLAGTLSIPTFLRLDAWPPRMLNIKSAA